MEIPRGRATSFPGSLLEREKRVLEAKILEAMYDDKLEFPGGKGVQNKKPSLVGVWIFSGTAQYCVVMHTFMHYLSKYYYYYTYCSRPGDDDDDDKLYLSVWIS